MSAKRFDDGRGPSQRQLRAGELIRRAMSDVLMRGEHHDPELARHTITVTEVRCSPDLRHATVFVMPLGGREIDQALDALKRARATLRRALARHVTMKYLPDLRFVLDESFDRMDETRRLLSEERVRRDVAHDDAEADGPGDAGKGGPQGD
ncbi:30S ribosome-binding factor RbfA [Oceanicella actignis]|uniref:30S ribosome-binding factor RbfA n=1 Tax=Oceanicella actignis TaxID=1189325 RepID=UPI0011E89518|nr:30S ribosome-binding factor RbfA [Oceanicella actignis]TYO90709.1 ribosome-binding factor A [Oceanicella actignis]